MGVREGGTGMAALFPGSDEQLRLQGKPGGRGQSKYDLPSTFLKARVEGRRSGQGLGGGVMMVEHAENSWGSREVVSPSSSSRASCLELMELAEYIVCLPSLHAGRQWVGGSRICAWQSY